MTTETFALNKLSAWKGNVRKTAVAEGLDELTASIRTNGILVPLIVQKGDKGERKVIAGQRRLLALRALQKEGAIPADHPVPCVVVPADADAAEISLIENVVRQQMHPADQFEAFRDLIDRGASIPEVAARWGISESSVVKLMKLGRVSPKILAAYRKGEIDMEGVQAFTLTDDHAVQDAYWKDAKGWQREARYIRDALTNGEAKASDKRLTFIGGLEVYEAAGGKVRRDLFDERNTGYVSDLTLLNKLVSEKLETIAAELRAEGWKWVEIMPELDWKVLQPYKQVHRETVELTPEQEARINELANKLETFEQLSEEQDLTDEQQTEVEGIQSEIDALQDRPHIFKSEDIARAGCIVAIGYRGETDIRRGWVKPEDFDASEQPTTAGRGKKEATAGQEAIGISAALLESLTAERTAALRVELANDPRIALATTVYALAVSMIAPKERSDIYIRHFDSSFTSCIGIKVNRQSPETSLNGATDATKEMDAKTKAWIDILPSKNADLWTWCLDQSQETLLELLAFCTAHTVNAIVQKSVNTASPTEIAHSDALANVLGLDMTAWFTPTAENYFGKIGKADILKALVEITGEPVSPANEKLKKGALAELAERTYAASDKTWLPEILGPKAASPAATTEDQTDELENAA
jgi:ParB family chromosome partitioning protein